jgi:hypothetical protein
VPEWQAILDAVQALSEIGVEASIGYGGVTLSVVTGLMLTAIESRSSAVSFGGVFVYDALIEATSTMSATSSGIHAVSHSRVAALTLLSLCDHATTSYQTDGS